MKQTYSEPPKDGREALQRLRDTLDAGGCIFGAGAGIGLSAKFLEKGGADLLVTYNSGRFRMQGRGSLAGMMPYGDANGIVLELANEILPIVEHTPVLAGVMASDPMRSIPRFLRHLASLGFVGVQNFPTVGLIDVDSLYRRNLEETGMGYDTEVDMIREAVQLGLLTTPYAFNVDEARRMAEVGADVVVAHMGLTTSGSIGAQSSKTLDDCVKETQAIADAARAVKPDVIVLVHGGPVAAPEDAQYVLSRTRGVQGFYGASSAERLPVEKALFEHTQKFKQVGLSTTKQEGS
ncbi:hypothetical protein FA10DRAFT_284690 [Acaromyces ingoldii]|uniref:TIM-barrel domain-containing protein n=1 Tax=Acaromyces ingoldii TaxID=215250 RepID=A0A316YVJ6_9BASI|nr:hypothetical protein FA10DRAFT_284690 [Acaromyces ingoldii]PWN91765.1 hypothetical protein FA10DRAFT_284690 [Acaromyces ingoldii]